jgi:hypothetical protein
LEELYIRAAEVVYTAPEDVVAAGEVVREPNSSFGADAKQW